MRSIEDLKRDLARSESARIAILAENEYYKTQYRRLQGILERIDTYGTACKNGPGYNCALLARDAKTPVEGVAKGVSEGVVLCPHCNAPFQNAWSCGMHALNCKAT